MEFFVPLAKDLEQAKNIYSSIAEHVSAPVPSDEKRIQKLIWTHEGKTCTAEIGKLAPDIFCTETAVLAIFECDDIYKICAEDRGVINFDPIYASAKDVSEVVYFD